MDNIEIIELLQKAGARLLRDELLLLRAIERRAWSAARYFLPTISDLGPQTRQTCLVNTLTATCSFHRDAGVDFFYTLVTWFSTNNLLSNGLIGRCIDVAIFYGNTIALIHFYAIYDSPTERQRLAYARIAVEEGWFAFAEWLLNGQYDPDTLCTAVRMACSTEDTAFLQRFLLWRPSGDADASRADTEEVALGIAVASAARGVLELLFAGGIRPCLIPAVDDDYGLFDCS
ncbi:hypothetical protein NKR23_g6501 [Pleurostoma richardsiae]|uniref:Uncharacterized protein n=1 Tax=Pleurostoma richardsiae TaxID=41990 RepID=A0AA38VP21_9PEZI|nr:hypothetical protein NKR23_g6501 [Pleurostoma richardsiae]